MLKVISHKALFLLLIISFTVLSSAIFKMSSSNQSIQESLLLTQKEALQLQLINQLNKLSLALNSLNKQRSQYVFLFSQKKISQDYKNILAILKSTQNPEYLHNIQDLENIIAELRQFKTTMKLRNDYLFHKKTLQTILNNNIALESFGEKVNIAWKMLKSALNSNNLITLGELNRSFHYHLSTVDKRDTVIFSKLFNMGNDPNGSLITARNIIRTNIKLEGQIYDMQYYSSVLVDDFQKNVQSIREKRTQIIPSYFLDNTALSIICFAALSLGLFCAVFLRLLMHRVDLAHANSISVLSKFYKNIKTESIDNMFYDSGNLANHYKFITETLYHFLLRTKDIAIIVDNDNRPVISSSSFDDYTNHGDSNFRNNKLVPLNKVFSISDQQFIIDNNPESIIFPIKFIHAFDQLNYKILFLAPARNSNNSAIKTDRLDSLGQISGEVAHDINNMLSVIIGCLNILRQSSNLVTKEDSQVIDRALFSADKSISIIDRLLTFACCQKLSPELVDVNDLIEGLYEVICFTNDKNILITLDLSRDAKIIYIDPGQLEACIINLCINSMNAIDHQGEIIIRTSLTKFSMNDEVFKISIIDNGSGIAKNIQHRIFEPFFTGQKKNHGQGLGLSMVYGFVKQSGGYINVDSEVGVGTTISLLFNLDDKS